MLRALIPYTMILLSIFFASKSFALDIVRIDTHSADASTQVKAIETVDGEIVSIKELKNETSDPLRLMGKKFVRTKTGRIILTQDIEYFYAKKGLLTGRAPKDDGGKGGEPFGRLPKDDE